MSEGVCEKGGGICDVLPSGGVSFVVQQAGDQYRTKTGPVRNWLRVFPQLCCIRHVKKSKIFLTKFYFAVPL